MTDLFLEQRESNRGCLILGILGALCAALVAWLVLRGKSDPVEANPVDGGDVPAAVDEDPAAAARNPAEPVRPGTTPAARRPPEALVGDLARARTLLGQGELENARALARQLAADGRNPETRAAAERLLGEIHVQQVLTPAPMAEKQDYQVKPGDTLGGIAKKFGTTVELVQRGNGITGNLIRKGQKLKVLPGGFTVRVDKSDFTLTVLLNGTFFKRYVIGTGKDDKTPEGRFKIVDRIKEPDWWRPDGKKIPFGDKENLLGTRWMALDARSYGIHGTWEPETIGKPLSAGCVRMRNEEVEELYQLLPVGTPVEIVK